MRLYLINLKKCSINKSLVLLSTAYSFASLLLISFNSFLLWEIDWFIEEFAKENVKYQTKEDNNTEKVNQTGLGGHVVHIKEP